MVCFVEISISIQIFSSKGKKSIIFKNPLTLVDTGHFFIPAPKPFSSYGSLFYVSWSLLFSDWDITGMDREWKYTLGITLSFARELTNRPFLSLISGISLRQGYFQTNPFPSCHVPAYSVELPGPSLTVSTVSCQGHREGCLRGHNLSKLKYKEGSSSLHWFRDSASSGLSKPKLPASSMLLAKHRKAWGWGQEEKDTVC